MSIGLAFEIKIEKNVFNKHLLVAVAIVANKNNRDCYCCQHSA
jgi:hypothetical protein